MARFRGRADINAAAWLTGLILLNTTAFFVAAQVEITRWTIDGGGTMRSAEGDVELSGTIGQPDAGILAGRDVQLAGGFWFPLVPGDCDTDGATDLIDYDAFHLCLLGPDAGVTSGCGCFDLDHDRDIDLTDVAVFQTYFSAP